MSSSLLLLLLSGLALNFALTATAVTGGLTIGLVLALMRLSEKRIVSMVAKAYINLFRSLPLVLILFWFYILVPVLTGHPVGAVYSAFIAFTVFEAAYFAEIIRAGINSVGRNQFSAALSVGMTPLEAWRRVVLPQALRNVVPTILTQSIILFQDTSLVYVLGLREFLTTADSIAQRDGRIVEMYGISAMAFLVICTSGAALVERLKKGLAL
ncbi:glutamate/aspartate transport system permease protein [Bradyrhizobium sp. USDA 326]|uniref:amino acid ABC transporter permease n=1 Tax=unclassified Bradyrhizobium TaxID=2631580 RepID=UPI0035191DFD